MRKTARSRILRLRHSMGPHLIRVTKGSDTHLRWEAVDSLGSIRDSAAIPAVMERAFQDPDVHVRWRSIWAITSLDNGTVARRFSKP